MSSISYFLPISVRNYSSTFTTFCSISSRSDHPGAALRIFFDLAVRAGPASGFLNRRTNDDRVGFVRRPRAVARRTAVVEGMDFRPSRHRRLHFTFEIIGMSSAGAHDAQFE